VVRGCRSQHGELHVKHHLSRAASKLFCPQAVSELIKSITALPSDATLLSLSPEPLLDLVCTAAQVQLTAVWLSLAALLVVQLDPPMWPRLMKDSDVEVQRRTTIVAQATTGLVSVGLAMLNSGAAMEANPDVAQDFFGYLSKV
jgi:hypothetical protein